MPLNYLGRGRRTRIVATVGPGSSHGEMLERLFVAGVDVFRINFSHGSHADHAASITAIRALEARTGRAIGILGDLQGPKLRVGVFADGKVTLRQGERFRLDLDEAAGDQRRCRLPHTEIIEAGKPGASLLLDDGKLRLRVVECGLDYLDTEVVVGGTLSNRKGVNVPDLVLPIPALTPKDRTDLSFALHHGVDIVALSFVQRPEDVAEVREIVGGRAWVLAKIEKPQALTCLDEIVRISDAIMVARGDLGVELPAEDVPLEQKHIVRAARLQGKPVVVATQMLESMVTSPTPTRAEASDVATAVYDGGDAVMLSAETAVGAYPVEAVSIMDRIICRVEKDPAWRALIEASRPPAVHGDTADAIAAAVTQVAENIDAAAIVAYTLSGKSALRIARERPACPIIGIAGNVEAARRMALVWGIHPVSLEQSNPAITMGDVARRAVGIARKVGLGEAGDRIVIAAGVPFGTAGTTNTLRVEKIE